jgi:hypothetical protein
MEPSWHFIVSSPYGDTSPDEEKLGFPLEHDPAETPYRQYFSSIRDFLQIDDYAAVVNAACTQLSLRVEMKEIEKIIVRAEKHGALYHPSSIELSLKNDRLKFGLNVAVTDTGRHWLKKEFSFLRQLRNKFTYPYLPTPYTMHETDSMVFLLEEWFEGYHEFHIARDEHNADSVSLWEFGKGYRKLTPGQSFEIYRQSAMILTLYYDLEDYSQIYPWHHAAGDFVAQVEDTGIDVRLTTVRQYDPYMVFRDKEAMNPVIALFYFFLNLTLKMRLDRLEGTGDTVWADDYCLEATVKGFFDGLREKEDLKRHFGSEREVLKILSSFQKEDFSATFMPLVELYEGTADFPVLTAHFDRHVDTLHAILQNHPA